MGWEMKGCGGEQGPPQEKQRKQRNEQKRKGCGVKGKFKNIIGKNRQLREGRIIRVFF